MKAKTEPATERLPKILARSGLGSRRSIDQSIERGEIRVNQQLARLGQQAAVGDLIDFGQMRFKVVASKVAAGRVLMYHKPIGQVCTRSDPQGRDTVFAHLPKLHRQRWIAIGRLDINTSGLLLFTTDGELAHHMMHPSSGVDREYLCRVHGSVSAEALQRLTTGLELDDGPARFSDLVAGRGSGDNRWYNVVLMEGRQREVRRLWAAVGVEVSRLKRVRYGAVSIPTRLKRGQFSEMTAAEVAILREDVGLSSTPEPNLGLQALRQRKQLSKTRSRGRSKRR